jgi:mannose-6-phosphate isomerase
LIHRIPVTTGDAIFIPSGRVHAIGTGNVLFEAQQNSDTTYRVFDWNRMGLDGKPRALHVAESLLSTDFDDVEPQLAAKGGDPLVACEHFRVEKWTLDKARPSGGARFAIYCVVSGRVDCAGRSFGPGDFFLVPAALAAAELRPLAAGTSVLRTTVP